MNNLIKHLKTVHIHRKYVRKACFKMGIPVQGLIHDLSKYSPTELSIAKYYSGTRSPHQNCREAIGYSPSWIHHYHKNKHHFQYWWDESETGEIIPIKMPYKYVIESMCDMVAAGKAYMGDNWKPTSPLKYYKDKCEGQRIMNAESEYLLKKLLECMSRGTEEEFYEWYKQNKQYLQDCYEKGLTSY